MTSGLYYAHSKAPSLLVGKLGTRQLEAGEGIQKRELGERQRQTSCRIAKKLRSHDQREGQLAQKPNKVEKSGALQRAAPFGL